jgi:glycine/D-amino acid oxidase-like deaminating enzyme
VTGPAPDVAIVGGGIVGTATAAFLAAEGVRVTLYEREGLAAGASGANSGVVQRPFDPALVPLYTRTVELYRELGDADAGFRLPDRAAGLLLVTHREAAVRRIATSLAESFPDLRPEVLVGAALQRLEPALAPGLAACRVPIGYPVPPSASTYAYATLAERLGARVRLGRSAGLAIAAGRVVGVSIDGRVEPAGAVVVAAGPGTAAVVDPSGRWVPVRPLWGVVVEVDLPDAPGHVLEEAEMDVALGTGDIVADPDGVPVPDPAMVPEFSLVTATGASAVGSTFLDREPDQQAWVVPILSHATRFVPGIATAPIRSVRACPRPLAADGRPLIGQVPGVEGLFVCSGHGPWGISTGPGSARLVADAILGRPVTIAAELDAARFGAPPIG